MSRSSSTASPTEAGSAGPGGAARRGHAPARAARRAALEALFEADFGMRTAGAALERRIDEAAAAPWAELARAIVDAVVVHRAAIDARIEAVAPAYPVVQLARIDRALLRSALGEVLHCPTTPTRVAISEWVGLARIYSGEPARRLVNGVLGRVATDMTGVERGSASSGRSEDHPRRPAHGKEGAA